MQPEVTYIRCRDRHRFAPTTDASCVDCSDSHSPPLVGSCSKHVQLSASFKLHSPFAPRFHNLDLVAYGVAFPGRLRRFLQSIACNALSW